MAKSYHVFGTYKTKEMARKKAKWFRDKAQFKSATVHKVKDGYDVHASGFTGEKRR